MAHEFSSNNFVELLKEFLHAIPSAAIYEAIAVIVNPSAGIYRSGKAFKTVTEELRAVTDGVSPIKGEKLKNLAVYTTTTVEEGLTACTDIAARAGQLEGQTLIVTAGGDGTANMLCSYLMNQEEALLKKIVLFRMPMGTGNDGLDALSMKAAWEKLIVARGKRNLSAVRVTLAHKEVRYAFNIASVGLDGWVTDLTNKIKKIIPGSFYSLMVDAATLFYEKAVHVDFMEIDFDGEAVREKLLLLAMGVSGHRTYGNNKLVLPGEENICAITMVPFFKKFKLKNNFYVGKHTEFEETIMRKAEKMTLRYNYPIPFQYDGEVRWLKSVDFPVEMEVIATGIQILT